MKRYIEIVMDNSGSMLSNLTATQSRMAVAKELFKKEVFPQLSPDDSVCIRTLRSYCLGTSAARKTPYSMLEQTIDSIRPELGCTPLFNTVKDAVQACKTVTADEKIIFVLTDGDDTCAVDSTKFFTPDELKYIRTLNVVLMQFAVDSATTRSNLKWFASGMGAQTFAVGVTGRTDFSSMRADLRTGLGNAGIIRGVTVNPNPVPDYALTWEELQNRGVLFYQAELLFSEGFLSWKPMRGEKPDGKMWSELLFLWSLRFGNGLPIEIVRTMLSGLQKPYAYSQSGVYWDFEKTRWIAPEPKPLQRLPNPEAEKEDLPERNRAYREVEDMYEENEYYKVEMLRQENLVDTPGYKLVKWNPQTDLKVVPNKVKNKRLKEGDIVQFVQPKPRGRKKKGG
ncbi:MAG: VWA domain-containing protein [Sphingomonadales bacterium]|nr:VWA domain-containing protein [Sphingomonadales bacterium]